MKGHFEKPRVRDRGRSKEQKVEKGRDVIKPEGVKLGENGQERVKGT